MMQDDQDELNIQAPQLPKQVQLIPRKVEVFQELDCQISPREVQAFTQKEDRDVIMNSSSDPTELSGEKKPTEPTSVNPKIAKKRIAKNRK